MAFAVSGRQRDTWRGDDDVLTVKVAALLTSYTVSSLGAAVPCSATTAGAIAYVTDATSPSWNATLNGGGSVHTLAMCNGANWTAH